MFTQDEIKLLAALIDVGIKNLGIGLYQNGNALKVQSILMKLDTMNKELMAVKPDEDVDNVEDIE